MRLRRVVAQLQHPAENRDAPSGRLGVAQHLQGSTHGLRPRIVAILDNGHAVKRVNLLPHSGIVKVCKRTLHTFGRDVQLPSDGDGRKCV